MLPASCSINLSWIDHPVIKKTISNKAKLPKELLWGGGKEVNWFFKEIKKMNCVWKEHNTQPSLHLADSAQRGWDNKVIFFFFYLFISGIVQRKYFLNKQVHIKLITRQTWLEANFIRPALTLQQHGGNMVRLSFTHFTDEKTENKRISSLGICYMYYISLWLLEPTFQLGQSPASPVILELIAYPWNLMFIFIVPHADLQKDYAVLTQPNTRSL